MQKCQKFKNPKRKIKILFKKMHLWTIKKILNKILIFKIKIFIIIIIKKINIIIKLINDKKIQKNKINNNSNYNK